MPLLLLVALLLTLAPPLRAQQRPAGDSASVAAGTRVRLLVADRPVEPLFAPGRAAPPPPRRTAPGLRRHVGALVAITADSVAIADAATGERLTVPRTHIVRLDSAAGRRSRVKRALLGAPIGFFGGALVGAPFGRLVPAGLAIVGTPIGIVGGALSGGERWARVRLPPGPVKVTDSSASTVR